MSIEEVLELGRDWGLSGAGYSTALRSSSKRPGDPSGFSPRIPEIFFSFLPESMRRPRNIISKAGAWSSFLEVVNGPLIREHLLFELFHDLESGNGIQAVVDRFAVIGREETIFDLEF
jgi:hypothetical protein